MLTLNAEEEEASNVRQSLVVPTWVASRQVQLSTLLLFWGRQWIGFSRSRRTCHEQGEFLHGGVTKKEQSLRFLALFARA